MALLGDSRPCVFDLEHDTPVAARRPNAHGSTGRRVAQRVRDEDSADLQGPQLVAESDRALPFRELQLVPVASVPVTGPPTP
jgi:hypothetical protein